MKLDSSTALFQSDQSQKTQEDAFLFLGQSFMAINQLDSALKAFKKVMLMTKSIAAAEAKYQICKIFHLTTFFAWAIYQEYLIR